MIYILGLPRGLKTPSQNYPAPDFCLFVIATTTSANSIILIFPFNTLTSIVHGTADPNLNTIRKSCTKLNRNTASIFKLLGGGLHCHPALVMTAADYTSTTAITYFVVTINPTTAPIHSATATMAQIAETICLHGENHRDFQLGCSSSR